MEPERGDSLKTLPSSLGKHTTLKEIMLHSCLSLTTEGLAPLQHLPGLTSLSLRLEKNIDMIQYPELICNLTSLIDLQLYSDSIETLPGALGNLTNLESLEIEMQKLKRLPESIGNLNHLHRLRVANCLELTALPESLDDLLWRKAHEKEGGLVDVDFYASDLQFSPKMKKALKILAESGVYRRAEEEWEDEDSDEDSDEDNY